jgi:hypothetical protein
MKSTKPLISFFIVVHFFLSQSAFSQFNLQQDIYAGIPNPSSIIYLGNVLSNDTFNGQPIISTNTSLFPFAYSSLSYPGYIGYNLTLYANGDLYFGNSEVGFIGSFSYNISEKNPITGDLIGDIVSGEIIISVTEPLSIDDISNKSFKIFPNPTQNFLNINSNFLIQSTEIIDVNGRVIQSIFHYNNQIILNIEDLANGMYYLKVNTENGSYIDKIIKN